MISPPVRFTVFTPTYNRADKLARVYDSLCAQTFRDFEWLIVDDGSTDETELCVKRWIAEAQTTIRYIRKENGGKHTAFNAHAGVASEFVQASGRYDRVVRLAAASLVALLVVFFVAREREPLLAIGWAWVVSQALTAVVTDAVALRTVAAVPRAFAALEGLGETGRRSMGT